MSVKRRDKKNRVLRNGESQRADGRYVYKYIDVDGKAKFVYSWKLVDTDTVPRSKRDCVSLRTQEKEIQKQLEMQLSTDIGKQKLIDCFEEFINNKVDIKSSTRCEYNAILSVLKRETYCYLTISEITTANIKRWIIDMHNNGRGYARLKVITALFSEMFKKMMEDELVIKNPFDFNLSTIVKKTSKKKTALTEKEEENFLLFIKNSRKHSKYYDAIYFMLNTGLRISELCGLCLSDIDLERKIINIDHQLIFYDGKLHLTSTKSSGGKRTIPITKDIEECLLRIISNHRELKDIYAIDNRKDFLFSTNRRSPTHEVIWMGDLIL